VGTVARDGWLGMLSPNIYRGCAVKQGKTAGRALRWSCRALPHFCRLVGGFLPRRLGFDPRPGHVGIVVDSVHWGGVSSNTTVSPVNSYSISCFISVIHHPGMVQCAT
jgi:hypothetical protein